MLTLKYLMMILGIGLFGSAGSLLAYDIYLAAQLRRLLRRNTTDESGVEINGDPTNSTDLESRSNGCLRHSFFSYLPPLYTTFDSCRLQTCARLCVRSSTVCCGQHRISASPFS